MQFHYSMHLDFDHPVREHHFTLKCLPRTSFRQEISDCCLRIDPDLRLWKGRDQFGNIKLMGYFSQSHDHLYADVSGSATVRFRKEEVPFGPVDPLKYPSGLTTAGPAVRALLQKAEEQCAGEAMRIETGPEELALPLALMNVIYQNMTYSPGHTDIGTSAEEAAESGRGVCQDYTHIMLAALRERKIPCRYVCGMLAGVGESHAWVEVYDQGAWVAYDPTNNVLAGDRHLVLSYGRDALDCRINQGVFASENWMPVSQSQRIVASVTVD